MKLASTIMINFMNAKKQADNLDAAAKQLRRIADSGIENSLQELSAAWKGEASDAYCRKGRELKRKILATAKKTEREADVIRNAARRTYNAEMTAYNLAIKRLYKK